MLASRRDGGIAGVVAGVAPWILDRGWRGDAAVITLPGRFGRYFGAISYGVARVIAVN